MIERGSFLSVVFGTHRLTDLGDYHLRVDFTSLWQHDLFGFFNIVQHEYCLKASLS